MADEAKSERVARITAEDKVASIVDQYPATIEVLKGHGFTQITNPVMRRTVARVISIGDAASMRGVDLEKLLVDLNAVVDR